MKRRHTTRREMRRDVRRIQKLMRMHVNSILIQNEIVDRHTRAMLSGVMDTASVRHILRRASDSIDWHYHEVCRLHDELTARLPDDRKGGEA